MTEKTRRQSEFSRDLGGPTLFHLPLPADLGGRVKEAEYARLLGYPDRRIPEGAVAEAAKSARRRFDRHARPWAIVRTIAIERPGTDTVELSGGAIFTSRRLARQLRQAHASSLAVAMVSAGAAADELAADAWRDGRVDDGYFDDRLNAAVVEHLAAWAGERLRELLATNGLAPTASYGPGYPGWDLTQMRRLGRCLSAGDPDLERSFEILDSGMIRPKSSMLTTFGVTADRQAAAESWRRSGCAWCGLRGCGYRREPRAEW